jgi:hypothetical protein
MAAAQGLLARLQRGETAVVCTGFVTPPWGAGETDGAIGAAVLARALDRFFGITPLLLCEEELVGGIKALVRTAGLNCAEAFTQASQWPGGCSVRGFTKDDKLAGQQAAELLEEWNPVAVISVERPGANVEGVYHTARGIPVTDSAAKVDFLFEAAQAAGSVTVGIGDVGNELGMGSLAETARYSSPAAGVCQCGCASGPTARLSADYPVVASVSDWGAYALTAAWAALLEQPTLIHGPKLQSRLMVRANEEGLLDGPTSRPIPAIDGVGEEFHRYFVRLLYYAVAEPLDYAKKRTTPRGGSSSP